MDVRVELEQIWRNAAKRHWLLNRIRERVPAGVDPRDVMQEAALRVLEYAEKGRTIGNVYAFLVTTALHICIDLRRSSHHRYTHDPQVGAADEEDYWESLEGVADIPDPEMRLKFDFAMEKLMGKRRKYYLMHELLGMTFDEIASTLGVSREQVVQSYSIAKRKEQEYVRDLAQAKR